MDKATLVVTLGPRAHLGQSEIDAGARLLELLRDAGFPITAALWRYRPEPGEWRLLIASPVVDEEGPRRAYERIQDVLRSSEGQETGLSLSDTSVVSPQDRMIRALRRALPRGNAAIRIAHQFFDGVAIEDAVVYPFP